MRQKLIFFLAITLGIFIFGIGKVQAASHSLSPSSGLAGSQFTITRTNFTAGLSVFVSWDSGNLTTSSNIADGSGGYSATAQVPSDATVGDHVVTVVGAGMGMGDQKNWFARIFQHVLAAGIESADNTLSSATFTVTAPEVPSTPENTNTAPANTNTQSSNTNTNTDTNTNTKVTTQSNSNNSNIQATAEPAPTVSTNTNEQTAQTKSTNEVKKEAKVCYFPWWLWLVLIFITVVNLILFWLRYWKKKPKQSEQK